jgi:Cysteine-rich secretory protein family
MKKILTLSIFLGICITDTTNATMVTLKPSLYAQMEYQAKIDRNNLNLEKRLKNKMRLAEIKSRKDAEKYKTTPQYSIATPTNNVEQTITPWVTEIKNVDMNVVRSTWLGWYNEYRSSLKLWKYSYESRLDTTAHDWNTHFAEGKWENHHRRNSGDSYYDFPVIDTWFLRRGIDPKVINRSKHTENVGYGYYNCNDSDCTSELIASIRTTWNFFMSEKGKSYDAHYRSIINPYFTKVGMDIIVIPGEKRYYLTMHFITE